MNYSLNVKSSSIVHTLLSNCVKLLGKVQKLLIKCISYSVISKRIRVVSPKFYTVRKNFTGPPVPTVLTNSKSVKNQSNIIIIIIICAPRFLWGGQRRVHFPHNVPCCHRAPWLGAQGWSLIKIRDFMKSIPIQNSCWIDEMGEKSQRIFQKQTIKSPFYDLFFMISFL